MEWLVNLLVNDSIAHTIIGYAFIIAVGVLLGKVKIFGVSLGVTLVLFVGIVLAHFGFVVNHDVLHFAREFGLILFVYTIGLQVGPGFFSSFKQGGTTLNLLAVGLILLGILTAVVIYIIGDGRIAFPMMVGILSGAVTNTPGLGAAEETLNQIGYTGEPIGLGYAVAYPLGVVGVILAMLLFRAIFRIKLDNENTALENKATDINKLPDCINIRITNKAINGKTIKYCCDLIGREFIISRLKKSDEIIIPDGESTVLLDDIALVVCKKQDFDAIISFLGETVDFEWPENESEIISRRILITRDEINGKTIGSLRLRSVFGLNITRVIRNGIELLATPDLVLQIGDKVSLVGSLAAIERAEKSMGNTLKRLREPHIISMFVGILIGVLVGSIPFYIPGIPMPAKLGLAGGPLIVSILVGRYGYKLKLISYTTRSANLMLREIGICLFLASVGLSSGGQFVNTITQGDGLLWIGCGFLITFIPALIIGCIGRWVCKLNYFTLIGLIAGSTTDPPALAYASGVAQNDAPAIAYSTVYPLTMFLRIISAQFLILIYSGMV